MISDFANTAFAKSGRTTAYALVPKLRWGTVLRKLCFVGQSTPDKQETEFRSAAAQTGVWEPGVFGLLVALYLLPVWIFAYVPTQDGPAHLANALILKELGTGQSRYQEFFEIRWEPLPNWTTHLVLAGLLYVFPPLFAHKVLVSLYLLGFAGSFRYFLGPFGRNTIMLAPAGLLFVYNRCFLTGFYNYCLSMILFWIILGYCLRRRDAFDFRNAAVLMALFWLAYFTHLLGYVFAAAGAGLVLATSAPRRHAKLGWFALAVIPTGLLAADSLLAPGLLGLRENFAHPQPWLWLNLNPEAWWRSLLSVNEGLFEPYEAWQVPLGVLVLFFLEALALAALLAPHSPGPKSPLRLPIALFGFGVGLLYLVLPDFLSVAIGFLKARLVLLPPLMWLACLRMPQQARLHGALAGFMYLLLSVNLVLISRYFYVANQQLAEYTAGINRIGHDRRLFVDQSRAGSRTPSYLEHAANYYCVSKGNINLDNYQAELNHFPVKYRSGIVRGRGDISNYPNRDLVDVILVWDKEPDFSPEIAATFGPIFQAGRLQLFERIPGK